MSRTPGAAVRHELTAEVGFGCPVAGCGSPYLAWHHFDPPWSERHHHEPGGMVALCLEHHAQADAGAFTREQLHEFNRQGRDRRKALEGRFNWMRQDLLAVVGGGFFYETTIAVEVGGSPVVWFTRDPDRRLMVNIEMVSIARERRMRMRDNVWLTQGTGERKIVCPPSGRELSARYPNGDALDIEFRDIHSVDELDRLYPPAPTDEGVPVSHAGSVGCAGIQFPIAAVAIKMKAAGTKFNLGPRTTTIDGFKLTSNWCIRTPVGLKIDSAPAPAMNRAERRRRGRRG